MTATQFTFSVILIELVFLLVILSGLRKSGASGTVIWTIGIGFPIWLAFAYLILKGDMLSKTGFLQVAFGLFAGAPVVAGLIAQQVWKDFSKSIGGMITETFLAIQVMRAPFGVLFFFAADLPLWFQLVGGLGDVAAGVGAYLALNGLRQNPDKTGSAIFQGNLAGILDFLVVLNVGILVVIPSLPASEPFNDMFNLIPLVVVPVFILLHIFSLQKLPRFQALTAKQS